MEIQVIDSDNKEERASLATPNASDDFWFEDLGGKTYSGKPVTEDTALTNAAFYAAVRIRSHAISTLPLILYKRVGDNKERATNHPLYPILKSSPNQMHTSQEWLELVSLHKDIQGNHFTFIIRNNGGQINQLVPVHPNRVTIKFDADSKEPFYIVNGDTHNPWSMNEVLHFRDLSIDGVMGISKIKAAKQAISYGLGLEDYGARFIQNDASSGVILTHPQSIGDDAIKGLKKAFEDSRRGSNKHRVAVLGEGVSIEKISIPPDDAQFLQSRQFSIQEIARFMGVPPHMLSDLSKSSFSNIESQELSFLFNTVRPELVKIEQRINKVLLANSPDYFVEFLFDARERADLASRYKAYSTGLNAGFLTANEVRSFENLSQVEGGDVLRAPLNTAPVGEEAREIVSNAPDKNQPIAQRVEVLDPETRALPGHVILRDDFQRDFRKTASEILEEEIPQLREILEDAPTAERLQSKLDAFFLSHSEFVRFKIEPLYLRFTQRIATVNAEEAGKDVPDIDEFVEKLIASAVLRWVRSSRNQLDALEDNESRLKRLDEWEEKRAGKFADAESTQVQGAAVRATFIAMGFSRLIWRTRGDNCPYCQTLNGKSVDSNGTFVNAGEDTTVEGLPPMRSNSKISHPPRHRGCDCYITAE
ncbi:hypothetical protein LCGC14_1000090 [marine sediment metagenome]|uniref:Phage head morphogenesis domain-containing protein n=1 Tax=marine sediment metagenome TaxID=412755 RepID=A0A0F9N818_9ZZZZ